MLDIFTSRNEERWGPLEGKRKNTPTTAWCMFEAQRFELEACGPKPVMGSLDVPESKVDPACLGPPDLRGSKKSVPTVCLFCRF